ncbi:MAG: hypothetical protein JW801_17165 [Bacteroidales bacterium]|nr:hypothetical protein [Bacteroidales bacterium]
MRKHLKVLPVFLIMSFFLVSCELVGNKANAPKVTIVQPDNGSSWTTADLISFTGEASDAKDGVLTGTQLTWVSDIDDTLGQGTTIFTRLSAGEHQIRLIAVDSEGEEGADVINITVSQGALQFDKDYSGFLHVHYTSTYPEWDVETQVSATIVGDSALIHFGTGLLIYSGETMVSDDSRIIREGEWALIPTGELVQAGTVINIEVDGGVTVQNDIQQIWALSEGVWVLVNETPFNETPDASLIFNLDEALTAEGSQCGITVATGSIIWTLTLIEG